VIRSRWVVAARAIGAFALLSFIACDENKESHYSSSEQAASDHAFERGWLPEELRRGATNISEFHDLDSNRGGASFDYSPPLIERLEKSCSKIPPNQKVSSPLGWPRIVQTQPTSAELSSRGVTAFQCGSFTVLLDTTNGTGSLWP
jgi:hypothetical protein